jgi:hypothetical protein
MPTLARKPLQIYLQPDQERILRAFAKREHISLAELIRRSIDRYVMEVLPPDKDPSLGLIGLGHSGRSDLSARHDELVAEQATTPTET